MIITFEPVEVMSVHSDTYDETLVGAIEGRAVVTQQGQEIPTTYYPLDANVFQMPVRGEHVFGCVYAGKHYYFSKANFLNKVNNPRRGTSGYLTKGLDGGVTDRQSESRPYGAYFKSSFRAKKLWLNEGDTIIQGRFGNSIRLGSNQFMTGSQDSRNLTESPNIKIVAGGFSNAPVYSENLESNISSEYLDDEKSSIYLTTDEYVPYQSVGVEPTFDNNPTYFKPQIILQSDRLVFNSKGEEGGIGIYSRDNVEIKSANKVEIDSPTIDIGSSTSGQAVLGNQDFIFLIESLIDSKISSNESEIAEELVTSGGSPTAKSIELTKEIIRLQNIKDSETYLSKKINVE